MPPFRFAAVPPAIGAPALKARGANVLRSELQIAQRAQKAAAPLAACLERILRVKKACRLLRHRGRRIRFLTRNRPDSNSQPLLAVGTALPSARHLCGRDSAAAAGACNGASRSLRQTRGRTC